MNKSVTLNIRGMSCTNCQDKIEKKLRQLRGIDGAHVSYAKGTANISYNPDKISMQEIEAAIARLNYKVVKDTEGGIEAARRAATIIIGIILLYVLLQRIGLLNLLVPSRLADTQMGYGMLFVIGLITSVHCIAMCGGINISQSLPRGTGESIAQRGARRRASSFAPALLYNLGRVISYTLIGAILGLVSMMVGGGAEAGLPAMAQGFVKFFAGLLMVIMGINMLGLFPLLRRFVPRMPKLLSSGAGSKDPLAIGLLNGLMPCGPLQSMQLVALASGNPLVGAISMFLFSLGTVPLMLGLGSIISALGSRFAEKTMRVGAVLVAVLGLAMLSQGASLSGMLSQRSLLIIIIGLGAVGVISLLPFKHSGARTVIGLGTVAAAVFVAFGIGSLNANGDAGGSLAEIEIENGTQLVSTTLSPGRYPDITVAAGTPVKWTIDAPDGSLNGCNSSIIIPEYEQQINLEPGENVIEFTPTKTGQFRYSCWMGMIRGTISVEKEAAKVSI